MKINKLINDIDELRELVSGWQNDTERSVLEVDMALERVKKIYEILRFTDSNEEEVAEETEEIIAEEEVAEEIISEVVITAEDEVFDTEEETADVEFVEEEQSVEILNPEIEAKEEPQEIVREIKDEDIPDFFDTSLFDELGFNDKLLIASELFGGDFELMQVTLNKIDKMPTLNDALIYIAENHDWSGDEDGAKLLYTLLLSRY